MKMMENEEKFTADAVYKKRITENFCVEIESLTSWLSSSCFSLHNICWLFRFGKIPLKK